MKFSLMTTTMVFEFLAQLKQGDSKKEVLNRYAKMMNMIAGLEIPAVEITSLELDMFGLNEIKRVLETTGLTVGGMIHLDQFACVHKDTAESIIESAKNRIDAACELKTDNLMLALMAQTNVTDYSQQQLSDALIKNIRPITEYGGKQQIKISVEDTPDIRLPLCSISDTQILLDALPDLYLTYDTGNMILKHDDPVAYLKAFKNRICHVHLKDMKKTEDPQTGDPAIDGQRFYSCTHGSGIIDFPAIARHINPADYTGYAVIEYTGHENHENNIRNAKSYLESIFYTE